ncbi:HupE/UreJ family protein [Aurantimonas sp. C2-6-R+9]|uniref:HupE/UreJ family protein n=1 Tax=unclassified Aurantimonas TaxID=2638230 RepID=UPI002E17163D|nr:MULTISPECIES: HupE/UreJ family protein [unclassified Aurantimonas]MEC5290327.1 HupE/UreJ family protein [Aurantimonas sp. C2-3-R2]MEC5379840.1 HupE/UreJ family protein [Aurantimonas sp. C2-6-R+9]MEC5411416.1 HupE/UreJ family protein [Aurantimonas sp. C2-4-R8]
MLKRLSLIAASLFAATAPAFAHINPAEHGSLLTGFVHPLLGWDHVLVMVAVGIWAAMIGGRALWAVPLAFVTVMSAGFALAVAGIALPFVEPVVLASVVALGLLIAMAVKLPDSLAATIVGAFALFHGAAHGAELGASGAAVFGLGFAMATALLHGGGLLLGNALVRTANPILLRAIGALSAGAGLYLMAG